MAAFGIGDRQEVPAQRPGATPVNTIISMRSQGLTNNQIIQSLQREGYKTQEIIDAMNQAELRPAASPAATLPGADVPGAAMPPLEPPIEADPMPRTEARFDEAIPGEDTVDERIEEIAEAIIDEKWKEMVKQVNKIVEWKQLMEARIQAVEARFNDLRSSFESLQQGIVQKVEDYDQNITNVGTEIKAMEKVFQKVLPQLTDSVNELSRIAQRSKEQK